MLAQAALAEGRPAHQDTGLGMGLAPLVA